MSPPGPATSPPSPPIASPEATRPASFAELRTRLEAGEVHRFIDGTWRQLARAAAGPDATPAVGDWPDHQTQVGSLLQALAAVHLGDAARSLLQAEPPAGVDHAALDEQLASLPGGRLDWTRFERTLAENHAVLVAHHPRVARTLGDLESVRARLAPLEAHRDGAGLVHVRRPTDGVDPSAGHWLGGFVDRRGERGYTAPRAGERPARLVIVGVGTGRLVDRAVATTTSPTGSPPVHVHVVEPDLDALAAWLALADRRATLADPRLLLVAGPGAVEAWSDLLAARPGLPLPDHILVSDPRTDTAPIARARAAASESRGRLITSATERLLERWREVDDAEAADRLRPGATIIGFTSRYTTMLKYAMREVGEALEALGYRFVLVEETEPGEQLFAGDIAAAIEREDAALVVTFNRLRPLGIPLFGEVPVLTIVLDPVDEILSHEGGARVGRRDMVAGFYAERAVEEFGYPEQRYHSLPFFPVSLGTFHDAPLTPDETARFDCDLVYVGHARGTADAWHEHCKQAFQPSIDPVLDAARARLEECLADGLRFVHHRVALDIVEEACRRTGIELHERVRSNVASMHVHRLNDISWRRTALEWAARWATRTGGRLHLHGDGWADDPVFRPFARGALERTTETRLAYRGARLALQLLPSGLSHQRTFEALSSGALVVARESANDFGLLDRPTFEATYGDGGDAPFLMYQAGFRSLNELVFADEEEFGVCVERWLADDEGRRERQASMAARVREHFTWDAVLPRILEATRTAIAGA